MRRWITVLVLLGAAASAAASHPAETVPGWGPLPCRLPGAVGADVVTVIVPNSVVAPQRVPVVDGVVTPRLPLSDTYSALITTDTHGWWAHPDGRPSCKVHQGPQRWLPEMLAALGRPEEGDSGLRLDVRTLEGPPPSGTVQIYGSCVGARWIWSPTRATQSSSNSGPCTVFAEHRTEAGTWRSPEARVERVRDRFVDVVLVVSELQGPREP